MSCPSNCECIKCCPEYNDCPDLVAENGCKIRQPLSCSQYDGTEFPCLDITAADTSTEVIAKIVTKVCELDETILNPDDRDKMVRISENDTTSGYLQGKLLAGPGISLTKNNSHLNESLTVSINTNTLPDGSSLNTPLIVTSEDNSIKILQSGVLNHTVDLTVNFGDDLPDANCNGEDVCECEPGVFVCIGPNGVIFNETPFAAIAGSGIKIVPGGTKGHAPTLSVDWSNTDNPDGPPDAVCDEAGENCECPPGVLVCLDGDGNPIFEMPNLQEVTDVGEITTNPIQVAMLGVGKYPTMPLDIIEQGGVLSFDGHTLDVQDANLNMFIGHDTGIFGGVPVGGTLNLALGYAAMRAGSGDNKIAIGYQANAQGNGHRVISIGNISLNQTEGDDIIAIGDYVGRNSFVNNSVLIGTNASSGELLESALNLSNTNVIVGGNGGKIQGLEDFIFASGLSNGNVAAMRIVWNGVGPTVNGVAPMTSPFDAKVIVSGTGTIEILNTGIFTNQGSGTFSIYSYTKTENVVTIGHNSNADRSNQVNLGNGDTTQLKLNNIRFNTEIIPTESQVPIWDDVNGEYRPGTIVTAGGADIILTTTGTSGPSTYNSGTGVLNIPNYSVTETDPVFLAHVAHSITNQMVTNWNAAFSWGNHAIAGYAKLTDISLTTIGTSGAATYNSATGVFNIPIYEDTYKVKIDESDTAAYLEEQIEAGTDPLGIVSISITKVGGKLRITPTIDVDALCTALQESECVCGQASSVVVG